MLTKLWSENLNEIDYSEDLDLDGEIILEFMLET
jgi:hypothetical protein